MQNMLDISFLESYMEESNAEEHLGNLVRLYEDLLHDIKSPLSIICALAQIIEGSKGVTCEVYEHVRKIMWHCNGIISKLEQFSQVGKLGSGRIEPEYKNLNAVYLAEWTANSVIPLAAKKTIDIVFDTNTEVKLMAVDKMMFERILLNLLSNAIKYSPENTEITVSFTDNVQTISVEVADMGKGIDETSDVFKRYFTTVDGNNRNGTGLGLDIVKEYCGILGGCVSARAGDGCGTVMRIEIPAFLVPGGVESDVDYGQVGMFDEE